MGKLAGIQAVTDVISILDAQWQATNIVAPLETIGGTKPEIEELDEKKIVDYIENQSYILVSFDDDQPEMFGMQKGAGEYDWKHTILLTLDVRTKDSKARIQQITDHVADILKNNARLKVNGNEYICLLPRSAKPDYTYRSAWRFIMEYDAERMNP